MLNVYLEPEKSYLAETHTYYYYTSHKVIKSGCFDNPDRSIVVAACNNKTTQQALTARKSFMPYSAQYNHFLLCEADEEARTIKILYILDNAQRTQSKDFWAEQKTTKLFGVYNEKGICSHVMSSSSSLCLIVEHNIFFSTRKRLRWSSWTSQSVSESVTKSS